MDTELGAVSDGSSARLSVPQECAAAGRRGMFQLLLFEWRSGPGQRGRGHGWMLRGSGGQQEKPVGPGAPALFPTRYDAAATADLAVGRLLSARRVLWSCRISGSPGSIPSLGLREETEASNVSAESHTSLLRSSLRRP